MVKINNIDNVIIVNEKAEIIINTLLSKAMIVVKSYTDGFKYKVVNSFAKVEDFYSAAPILLNLINNIKYGTRDEITAILDYLNTSTEVRFVSFNYYKKELDTDKIKEIAPYFTYKDSSIFIEDTKIPNEVAYQLIQYRLSNNIRSYRLYLNCWINYAKLLKNRRHKKKYDFLVQLLSEYIHVPTNNGFCFFIKKNDIHKEQHNPIFSNHIAYDNSISTRETNIITNIEGYDTLLLKSSKCKIHADFNKEIIKYKNSIPHNFFTKINNITLDGNDYVLVNLSFDLKFNDVKDFGIRSSYLLLKLNFLIL